MCNFLAHFTSWHLDHLKENHDDIIKWKHFPHYWPFVRGIHRSLVNSPHKEEWCRALMFSLICTWTNSLWANNGNAGDLRCYHAHCDVIVMLQINVISLVIVRNQSRLGQALSCLTTGIVTSPCMNQYHRYLVSISIKASYPKILWNVKTAWLVV